MISVGLQLIDERGDYLLKGNWLLDCYLLLKFAKKNQVYEFTHYDYGVWTSSIVWFQDRHELISHKGNKSLLVYGPCSYTTELNALLTGDNNGRYPWAPRSCNWSLNSPSSCSSPVIPYKSPVLQLNAITLVIHLFLVVVEIDNRFCQCLT